MLGQKDVRAAKPAYRTTNGGQKMLEQKGVKQKLMGLYINRLW
jgi:hypothetical protein